MTYSVNTALFDKSECKIVLLFLIFRELVLSYEDLVYIGSINLKRHFLVKIKRKFTHANDLMYVSLFYGIFIKIP